MTVGSILLAVALLVIVGLYVFRPILTPSRRPAALTERDALLAEKENLINAIKALDFDYETGKVPMDQYEEERTRLKLAAANTLQQAEQAPQTTDDLKAQIEAAIAALRAIPVKQVVVKCAKCQTPVSDGDKFCRNCGEAL